MIAASIDDLRVMAQRRLPRAIFDYIEGGACGELTVRANREDFDRIRFRPKLLVDVSRRSLETTIFGQKLSVPLILGPVGSAGVFSRRGEAAAARAAERCGTTLCLSNHSICSIEEVAAARKTPFWFQLYMGKDREECRQAMARAEAAGCSALVFTVDALVSAKRDRDVRNGRVGEFSNIPSVKLRNVLDAMTRPEWCLDMLRGGRVSFGNYRDGGKGALLPIARMMVQGQDASVSWKEVDWVRSLWKGPLVIKGVLTAEDARLAVEHGANGVVVSSHGGRQLDGAPSSISALPSIADAIGGRATILLDSGVRRGQDIIKALALGADACLVGRALAYALGAMGEAGVERAIRIFEVEMSSTLAFIGKNGVDELDRSVVDYSG